MGVGAGYIFMVMGLLVRAPTTLMPLSFALLFPLTFASNIMVRPETMPPVLRVLVELNPVSLMATAIRGLMAGTVTGPQILYALVAPVALTLTLSPVVIWLSRRK